MMDTGQYIFNVTPMDADILLPQVSRALEKRTELLSRERYPELCKQTDKLNSQGSKHRRNPTRTKVTGILCLLLGLFLFIPGMMKPQELLVPLIAGAFGVVVGLASLWRSRKRKKNPFDEPARKLLAGKASVEPGRYRVCFSQQEMTLKNIADHRGESVPYSTFEYVIETEDTFLITFGTRVSILQKKDLSEGGISNFRSHISSKVNIYTI